MKTIICVLLFFVSMQTIKAVEWASLTGASNASGKSIAVGTNGTIYVLGSFSNTAQFGATSISSYGNKDIFIAKYTAAGALQWVKQIGSTQSDNANSIKIGANGRLFIYGQFQGSITLGSSTLTSFGGTDVFVACADTSGSYLWAKSGGTTGNDFCYEQGMTIDKDDNLVIVGNLGAATSATFGSITIPSSPNAGVFIVKYDSAGNLQWGKSALSSQSSSVLAVTCDKSRNAILTGSYIGSLSFGSNMLSSLNTVTGDVFIAKYDVTGNVVWVKSVGGSNSDEGSAISSDKDNNIFVAGQAEGNVTFGTIVSQGGTNGLNTELFISKFDSAGQALWVKRAGSHNITPGFFLSNDILNDATGNVYWTGRYFDTLDFYSNSIKIFSQGGTNVFIAKYDGNGTAEWALDGGGNASEESSGLCLDNYSNLLVTGYYDNIDSITKFGNLTFTANHKNTKNLFLAKVATNTGIINSTVTKDIPVLYPNPTVREVYINGVHKGVQIQGYNVIGQRVINQIATGSNETIDVSNLKTGNYIFVITNSSEGTYRYKLTKN